MNAKTGRRPIPERMERLYQRLADFGITRKYALSVALPPGWNDAETTNPAVYSQALSYLSRHLNLDLRTLQDENAPLAWMDCGPTLFKYNQSVDESELARAKCLAVRAAQVACRVVTAPPVPLPDNGAAIRSAILERGAPCVHFESLLNYCWDCGLPVLHVSHLPEGAKKPDALAGIFAGRPAIVLMKRHTRAAWLLFILAHEIGHIGRRHLDGDGLLLDAKVSQDNRDTQEEEANAFAVEILTGKPDIRYQAASNLNAEQLAERALMVERRDKVDAGFVALNYVRNRGQGYFALGNKALEHLPNAGDPVALIQAKTRERLNWEELSRDSRLYLRRMTDADGAA